MKTTHRNLKGFTLIELLVVMAIIAVLASAGFAAGNAAIQKARKTTALATATAIESGVNNFYTEYGTLPAESPAEAPIKTDTDTTFLNVMLGTEAGNSPINTRGIKFLSVKEGKANKNGLIYNGSTVKGLYDPWGGGFQVALDHDYDELVVAKPSAGGQTELRGRRVAVWSNGADGVKTGGKGADDVKTW